MELRAVPPPAAQPVVVLGEFDGFHLGHRQLLQAGARLAARDARPLVAVVLDEGRRQRLSPEHSRELALLRAGAHATHVVAVDSDDQRAAAAHVVDLLVDRFAAGTVVMACLPGTGIQPRHPNLRSEVRARGLELVEVERWTDASGEAITSTGIVTALRCGDVSRAAAWLGIPYELAGEVVHGSALGRTIGFPTANVLPPAHQVIPANGVYAGTVRLGDGNVHRAAINVGVRPTVADDGRVLVEAHLIDFDGDLYGTEIGISFRQWLRGETRFDTLDALVVQLTTDVERARIAFGR